jgi:hypothetical protein
MKLVSIISNGIVWGLGFYFREDFEFGASETTNVKPDDAGSCESFMKIYHAMQIHKPEDQNLKRFIW